MLGTVLFAACDEDDDQNAGSETSLKCKIEQIIYKADESEEDDEDYIVDLTYGSDGQILKIADAYSYESNGETITEEYEFKITYENGKAHKGEFYLDSELRGTEKFVYSGDNLTKVTFTDEDGEISETRIMYNGNTPNRIEIWDHDNEEGIFALYSTSTLSFSGSNLIKELEKEEDGGVSETNYTAYDQNINPYYGNVAYLVWGGSMAKFFSKNNVVAYSYTSTEEDEDYNYSSSYSSSYTYNEDGFPTKIMETYVDNNETEVVVTEMVYQCGK